MKTYWIRLVCATVWAIMVANGECQSALTSFFNPYTNQQEIVYIGTDQNVHLIYYTPDSLTWADQNMTTASGATVQPALVSALTSFFNPYTNQQEIAYVGTDQNIHLIYYTPGSLTWADQNMTTASGATVQPVLVSALTSFFNPYTNQQEIAHIGTEQNIHLIYYTPGSLTWADQNVTVASGAGTGALIVNMSVTVANLTHPDLSPNFEVGDTFQITVIGPPNQPVSLTQTPGTTAQIGYTDANGNFTLTGVEQTSNIGSYTQVWSIAGTPITPAISFVVVQLGGGGTVSTTDIGQTSDGSVIGISTLSVANGTVSTYSVTELDYNASLYYNAQTVGTLFQDGTAIVQGVSPVSGGAAGGGLSATAVPWATYDLQTDHYVVIPEIFFVDGYYQNTLYFGAGSCYEVSSDCTIGSGGGFYLVLTATIYLGSTLADQTNVPQDGTLPPFNGALYDNFLASSEPPYPTGAVFKVDVTEWRSRLLIVSSLAAGVATSVKLNNPPVPFFVEFVGPPDGDKYVADQNIIRPPQGERRRTYILKDVLGRPWPMDWPVVVRERFSNKVGPGSLPAASGIWYNGPEQAGGTAIRNSEMTDHYALNSLGSEVGFMQYYYASGFTAPSWLQLPSGFSVPGATVPGLVVPLAIKDVYNSCGSILQEPLPYGQPVRLNPNYTGIDGDNGPPPAQGCAPPL